MCLCVKKEKKKLTYLLFTHYNVLNKKKCVNYFKIHNSNEK